MEKFFIFLCYLLLVSNSFAGGKFKTNNEIDTSVIPKDIEAKIASKESMACHSELEKIKSLKKPENPNLIKVKIDVMNLISACRNPNETKCYCSDEPNRNSS